MWGMHCGIALWERPRYALYYSWTWAASFGMDGKQGDIPGVMSSNVGR